MPRPTRRRLVLSLLATASLGLVILLIIRTSRANYNRLALGAGTTVGTIDVALSPPQELDGMTRAAVLDLRRQAVASYPDLLAGSYTPSPQVFQIGDSLPWWGIAGQFYYDKGEHSIDGPSEESRFILNPYLLVAAELRGLSIWSDGERALAWDKARITGRDLADPDFPFYCRPTSLRWSPQAARATVIYDVSGYLAELNRWTSYPLTVADASLDLIAYNARDMGLSYLYLSPADSDNLSAGSPMESPMAIPHFLHAGGSCGYPGGCNNMSPRAPELVNVRIERLPARAMIWLWRDGPTGVEQPPDMTFVIDFQ
ncbi:MAG: hypothetical protein JXM73_08400 [Anaerolineae bacterium]|nr:hypothetical protein [Anaerolineae bacterium]